MLCKVLKYKREIIGRPGKRFMDIDFIYKGAPFELRFEDNNKLSLDRGLEGALIVDKMNGFVLFTIQNGKF